MDISELWQAVQSNDLDLVELLVTNSANINIGKSATYPDTVFESPLHCALRNNYLHIATYLLSHNAEVNEPMILDGMLHSTVCLAIKTKNHDILDQIIPRVRDWQLGEKEIDEQASEHKTPFQIAIETDPQIANKLASHCDVHAVSHIGSKTVTPLYESCVRGHGATAEKLLIRGANPNEQSIKNGALVSCLHAVTGPEFVIDEVGLYITELLIQYKADLNIGKVHKDFSIDEPPLHNALAANRVCIAQALISAGADVDRLSSHGNGIRMSALSHALLQKNLDIIEYLVQKCSSPLLGIEDNQQHQHLLHLATRRKFWKIAEFLITHVDVDAISYFGDARTTAIFEASAMGATSFVKKLIDADADFKSTCYSDRSDMSCLYAAAEQGHTDTVLCLIEHGASVNIGRYGLNEQSCLSISIENGHIITALELVKHGVDVKRFSLRSQLTLSPMFEAVNSKSYELVVALHLRGADLNEGSENTDKHLKHSCLYQAIRLGYSKIAIYLIEHGSDLSTGLKGPKIQHSNLYEAVASKRYDITQSLLEKGADVDEGARIGETHFSSNLFAACENDDYDMIKLLLDYNADPNLGACDAEGISSCIRLCLFRQNTDGAALLIDKGASLADPNLLVHACKTNCKDLVAMMLEKGADIHGIAHDTECRKQTALYTAIDLGLEEIAIYLVEQGALFDKEGNLFEFGREVISSPTREVSVFATDGKVSCIETVLQIAKRRGDINLKRAIKAELNAKGSARHHAEITLLEGGSLC